MTRTRTQPAPGVGRGASRTDSCERPPHPAWCTARIILQTQRTSALKMCRCFCTCVFSGLLGSLPWFLGFAGKTLFTNKNLSDSLHIQPARGGGEGRESRCQRPRKNTSESPWGKSPSRNRCSPPSSPTWRRRCSATERRSTASRSSRTTRMPWPRTAWRIPRESTARRCRKPRVPRRWSRKTRSTRRKKPSPRRRRRRQPPGGGIREISATTGDLGQSRPPLLLEISACSPPRHHRRQDDRRRSDAAEHGGAPRRAQHRAGRQGGLYRLNSVY
jgi:hypothetical protein